MECVAAGLPGPRLDLIEFAAQSLLSSLSSSLSMGVSLMTFRSLLRDFLVCAGMRIVGKNKSLSSLCSVPSGGGIIVASVISTPVSSVVVVNTSFFSVDSISSA